MTCDLLSLHIRKCHMYELNVLNMDDIHRVQKMNLEPLLQNVPLTGLAENKMIRH